MSKPDTEDAHPELTTLPPASEETRLGEEAGKSWQKENRKILVLVLGVAAFMLISHFTPLRGWITNVQTWKGYVDQLGWVAHLGFGLVVTISVMVGIPRLALCGAAGLIFGFAEGLTLSLLGSTLGSYGAFLVARRGGRRAVLSRVSQWSWLSPLLERPSWLRVFWVRQLMLPGLVLNVLLGVTTVRHRTFLLGTLLGYLPLNIALSLVGSGIGKDSLVKTLVQLCAALALINIVGWLVWRKTRQLKVR
ncbi:TVP38/TMEM64 family protein [Brevifollis gellanilyticus]|uniref:TVP38/TMEM64 family membrane protein n=1 Tax=Brevifollis gellanilyticus TaxID=748831 RepID=A0A512M1S9_9BACT|nr:VTT domain-containing protein [Brevifollis gellanilyticus]GEP40710.1 TVP38/TMEM64 family membrane protein [Brevifollis gellanilyticus]